MSSNSLDGAGTGVSGAKRIIYTAIEDRNPLEAVILKADTSSNTQAGSTNEEELVDLQFDGENVSGVQASDKGFFGKLFGFLFGDKGAKDGEISGTKQGTTGDCWLLAGINALSYSEEGRELIKNALEYEEDYTIVHLKGFGDVVVTNDDLEKAKLSLGYSDGDDDMVIFELAMEQVMDEIASGDEVLDPDAPWFIEDKDALQSGFGEKSVTGGHVSELIYYLTGKSPEIATSPDGIEKLLNKFEENNNKDVALGVSVESKTTVTDIDGNKVTLSGPHAYAVKEVKDGVVTFTNPWNSDKEIKLDMQTFLDTFSKADFTDLSENNPCEKYVNRTFKIDDDGNRVFTFDRKGTEYFDDNMNPVSYSYEEVVYAEDGTILKRVLYNEDGTKGVTRTFDPKTGEQTGYINHSEDGKKGLCTDFNEKGENTYRLAELDENGEPATWYYLDDYEEVKNLNSRGLLDYEQFDINQIKALLKLSDEEWQKAQDYLEKTPNASFSEIMKLFE